MNLTLTLILSWFVVSIPFGILLGKALKVLARQESEGCASPHCRRSILDEGGGTAGQRPRAWGANEDTQPSREKQPPAVEIGAPAFIDFERRPPRDTESGLGWHNDPVKPARGDIRT
jgi:hypothetical protein